MKRLMQYVLASLTTVSMSFVLAASNVNASDDDLVIIDIDVAPNVLNIQSNSTVVTVHTDIPFNAVATSSVYLNGVLIEWWKSDNQGNFVAKFVSDQIKELVDDGILEAGEIFLTLVGDTTGGDRFSGVQEIVVIDIVPKGKK